MSKKLTKKPAKILTKKQKLLREFVDQIGPDFYMKNPIVNKCARLILSGSSKEEAMVVMIRALATFNDKLFLELSKQESSSKIVIAKTLKP